MGVDQKNQIGFGNHFATEALPGALPQNQNSPQKPKYGLYAEQLSGSAFTAPRHENLRSWLYRIRPSVVQGSFKEIAIRLLRTAPVTENSANPTPMRWNPLAIPSEPTDFVDGLVTIAASGDSSLKRGCAAHLYVANQNMENRFFYDADGELLVVPQEGRLVLRTECGELALEPGEIAVLPRGLKFQVTLPEGKSRGYVCENYGAPLRLPQLGPIGANGLANARDFESPVAKFEDRTGDFQLVTKFQGKLWQAPIGHSPLDVVAWHGNYAPYKYALKNFNTVNTVSYDHSDPSIFTVLTSPSEIPGVANVDFVIFPPRWSVAENTFRPPYYHRNCMSEYMGLLYGSYDAKGSDYQPGGGSLHNVMSAHGPDADAFEKASGASQTPQRLENTMAIMFESGLAFLPTAYAVNGPLLQKNYLDCWKGLKSHFQPKGGKHG